MNEIEHLHCVRMTKLSKNTNKLRSDFIDGLGSAPKQGAIFSILAPSFHNIEQNFRFVHTSMVLNVAKNTEVEYVLLRECAV